MGSVNIKTERKRVIINGNRFVFNYYTGTEIKKFKPKMLGVGDLSEVSRQTDAIAAVFDLAQFTNFCRQTDSYLILPKYLTDFLNWLFENITIDLTRRNFRKGKLLYTELPFFAKFLGDGVLFLWNTRDMNMAQICNVIVLLSRICGRYNKQFFPEKRREMSYIPSHLRCGVARGSVCSVGGGKDYVGVCINIASRLQKLSKLTFCFCLKGIDFKDGMQEVTASQYTVKAVEIRGIGEDERVCIRKAEYKKLPKGEQGLFRNV